MLLRLFLIAMTLALASLTGAQPIPNPAKPCVSEGRILSTQTGPCCDGLVAVGVGTGWRCLGGGVTTTQPTVTTTTVRPTTTTRPAVTTTTSARPPVPATTTTQPGTLTFTKDDGPPMPTRFPTGWDHSIRRKHDQLCRWWADVPGGPLRTATQTERAMTMLYGIAVLMPEALTYAKYTPGCEWIPNGKSLSDFDVENLRLRTFYVDPLRDKEWSLLGRNGCDPYGHVEDVLERIQVCSTRREDSARACAASFWMSGDLLAAADLRIEDGRCVPGARFATPTYPAKEDPELRLRGHLLYTIPLPPVSAAQRALATTALRLHEQASRARCGEGSPPPPGAVQAAILDLMRSAVTEKQRHAFAMVFSPKLDTGESGWATQDVCDLAMWEHFAWVAWDACFDLSPATQWTCFTRARINHETPHVMAAHRNPRARFRVSDLRRSIMDFPALPQDAQLAVLRAPTHGMPWLPTDWRIMVGPETHH